MKVQGGDSVYNSRGYCSWRFERVNVDDILIHEIAQIMICCCVKSLMCRYAYHP